MGWIYNAKIIMVQPLWKAVWQFVKVKTSVQPNKLYSWTFVQREMKTMFTQKWAHVHRSFLVKAKSETQPRCPSTGEWLSKLWFTHMMKCCSVVKEKRPLTCNNLGKSAKEFWWAKISPLPKCYILYDSIYKTCLKWKHFRNERTDLWFSEG